MLYACSLTFDYQLCYSIFPILSISSLLSATSPSPSFSPYLPSPLSLFQSSFPAGGGLSLSSISPSSSLLSLPHLVRQLWLARVQWGGKVWREEEEKEKEGGGGGRVFKEAINCKAQGTVKKKKKKMI